MLQSINMPKQYNYETIKYYIAWRFDNSTIKSSTLNTEIQNIRGACKRKGITLYTKTQTPHIIVSC